MNTEDLKVDYKKDSSLNTKLEVHEVGKWLNKQQIPYDFNIQKKIPCNYSVTLKKGIIFRTDVTYTYEGIKIKNIPNSQAWSLKTSDSFKQLTPTAKKVLNRVKERLNLNRLAIGQNGNFYKYKNEEKLCEISGDDSWDCNEDDHKGYACRDEPFREVEKIPEKKLEIVADDLLFVLNAYTNYWVCDRKTLVDLFDRFDGEIVSTLEKISSNKKYNYVHVFGFGRRGLFF